MTTFCLEGFYLYIGTYLNKGSNFICLFLFAAKDVATEAAIRAATETEKKDD